ncbi:MAG: class I SAM-dependent methyltransferase [candidate division NC10 bacterium]|nr:class I SAM-dependent methyltransferase [candidate division NC10 bacterium]
MISQDVLACPFGPDRLSRLSQLERWHFWFVGRRALIDRLLNRYLDGQAQVVLDLGCGTGLMLEILMRRGHRVVGLDLRPEGLYATRQVLPRSWLLQAEVTYLPLRDNAFGAVMLLDVLEHVDDRSLLAEVQRVLRPGGLAVITVPAIPWLWSYRDEAAGHLRRYTRQRLFSVLTDAGFHVREMHYYQCLLLPLVVITRLFGRRGPRLRDFEERPLPIFNAVMTWINRLEVQLSDLISWPWGSSLVVICRKS